MWKKGKIKKIVQQRSSQDHRFFAGDEWFRQVRRWTVAFWQRYGFVVYRARAGAPHNLWTRNGNQSFTREVQEPCTSENECHSLEQQNKDLGSIPISLSLRNTTRHETSAVRLWKGNPAVSPSRKQLCSQKLKKGTPETRKWKNLWVPCSLHPHRLLMLIGYDLQVAN